MAGFHMHSPIVTSAKSDASTAADHSRACRLTGMPLSRTSPASRRMAARFDDVGSRAPCLATTTSPRRLEPGRPPHRFAALHTPLGKVNPESFKA